MTDLVGAFDVVVATKFDAAEGVTVLELERPDGGWLPDWEPGAHVDVMLPNGMTRQYSLCGDRSNRCRYRVGILREPRSRGGSQCVHDDVAVGDKLGLCCPRNNFAMVPAPRYLFVAGGIGITPILPMLRQTEIVGGDWALLYGGRRRESMAFLDELAAYGDRVHVAPQDETGLLDLPAWLGQPRSDTVVYCCGPGPLLDAVETAMRDWPSRSLRIERFEAKQQGAIARDEAFEVELVRTGATVTVTPDVTILDAAREAGASVQSSCEAGTCGTCETAVLEGVPDHRDSILDDEERAAGQCLFPCVSRSCSSRLVLDL